MKVLLLITALLSYHIHSNGVLGLPGDSTDVCAALNGSCEQCVAGSAGVRCYRCGEECLDLDGLSSHECPLEDIKLGQCSLTGLALVVIVSSGAFMLLVASCVVFCACIYCYRRFCRNWQRAETTQSRTDTDMSEMQERHTRRQTERAARGDELRRKYGLVDEEDTSRYQRL